MPNIASVLKHEIARIARKELRGESGSSKKAISDLRSQFAAMKRRLQALEKEVARLRKQSGRVAPATTEDTSEHLRFRSAGFAKHRERLGLSAREMGLLLGASALSVYKWEQGKAKPRAGHMEAIAAVRRLGKREAANRLEVLTQSQ